MNITNDTLFEQRSRFFKSAFLENQNAPEQIRFAKGLEVFLDNKDIIITQDELLAGYSQNYDYSLPEREEGKPEWTTIFHSDQEQERQWYKLHTFFKNPAEEQLISNLEKGYKVGLFHSYTGGHVIAGYDKVLELGFVGLRSEAEKFLEKDTNNLVAQASIMTLNAAIRYISRYAQKAESLAAQKANKNLSRIASACTWISQYPPRSFFEATQLLWLTHEILICEQRAVSLSLGRLDQYLYPFYKSDIAAGSLTESEAEALVQALWTKFGSMRGSYQNVTLGGMNEKGEDETNPLTLMCLRASRILKMEQPLITARCHPNISTAYWNEIQALLEVGLGFPALFNDTVAIKSKETLVGRKDATNYGIVGCVEVSVPGKEFSFTELLRINWAKLLELMLNGGECPISGELIPLENPDKINTINTFSDFFEWYKRELAVITDLGIEAVNLIDRDIFHQRPYPFLSTTMDGCLESGKDVTAGGTIYNLSSVNSCGMADTVDSLASLKKFVFEEQTISMPDFVKMLRLNFTNSPNLLTRLELDIPKYGNDNEDIDAMMATLADGFCKEVNSHTNPRGGKFQTGLYTVDNHAKLGKLTGALPNGRVGKISLANAISPCQGADVNGPTAVINSVTQINHAQCGNGIVFDLKFHPRFFLEPSRKVAFRCMVETYFDLGGMQVQFNILDKETLLKAQQSPEQYKDLIVRVSGFSAYFINLDRVLQNEIIARTDQAEYV